MTKNLDLKIDLAISQLNVILGLTEEKDKNDKRDLTTKLQDRINALLKYREDNKINETFEGQMFTSELEAKDTSCYWIYVKYGLEVLYLIHKSFYERYHKDKLESEIFGVKDLKNVHMLIETIICWGLYPSLMKGVGISLGKRVNSKILKNQEEIINTSQEKDWKKIFIICQCFYDILDGFTDYINATTIQSIILQKYIPDLYSGLLQLGYCPIGKPLNNKKKLQQNSPQNLQSQLSMNSNKPITPANLASSIEQLSINQKDDRIIYKEKSIAMFNDIYLKIDPYYSIQALTLLLGSNINQSPIWLKVICGRYLSKTLLRNNGMRKLLEFMIQPNSTEDELPSINALEKMAKLVTTVPWQANSVEDYCSIISNQIIEIFVNESSIHPSIVKATAFISIKLIQKYPSFIKKYLIDPIIEPLTKFSSIDIKEQINKQISEDPEDLDSNVIKTEDDIKKSIISIHLLLIGNEPCVELMNMLSAAVIPLYFIYELASKNSSNLKTDVYDILSIYFRIVKHEHSITILKTLLYYYENTLQDKMFGPGPTGGIVLKFIDDKNIKISINPDIYVDFLKLIDNADLISNLFLQLLFEWKYNREDIDKDSSTNENMRIMTTIQIIMKIIEKIGHSIIKKPDDILSFVKSMLVGEENDIESLTIALSLLETTLSECPTLNNPEILDEIMAILQTLNTHEVKEIREVSKDLRTMIIAQKKINSSLNNGKTVTKQRKDSEEQFRQAMKDMADELLPVRAHGMTQLRHMILKRDEVANENLDDIIKIFLNQIEDQDSFIYLNAVKGLSALTDTHPFKTIPEILKIYKTPSNKDNQSQMDYRLRLGEALLQTIQRAGDTFGKYVDIIIPDIFIVLHDEAPEMRSSALSLLSMVCETCPLSLTRYFTRITEYVLDLLALDKVTTSRRGAVGIIVSLLRGLGTSNTIQTIPAKTLKRIETTLAYIEAVDTDKLIRYNARVGLDDLHTIIKLTLFPDSEN
ncbi:hypothetical protein BCR32DRAFT_272078 [Anaeromyces robustus]|uniref:RNA polymerase II assembly factor Rtp1 C-terminal domain-containing protein n=1 Tax=Anaeromyces robustus TaxID=1754192 RepID=A0A1Y1WNN9_9FUNG|nr:hypothetical protein BCR32DRAFT_272078 [Anaeromyces robustus]|eukprot:ORX75161.1 hypothetical protein BCR32DRAFT_272078 [Anaeromyces robustus]